MAQFKISEYPAKTVFNDGDLYDISTYDGVSAYTSEKLTFAQLKTELNSALSFVSDNLYTADGTLSANRTVTMGGNSLSFSGGNLGFGTTADVGYRILVSGVSRMQERLDFGTGTGTATGKLSFGGGSMILAANTTNDLRLQTATGDIVFDLNIGERARFTTTGLGLGISNPAEKLHVNGNAQVDGQIGVRTTPNSDIHIVGIDDSNSTVSLKLRSLANNKILEVANGGRIDLANGNMALSPSGDNWILTNLKATGDIRFDTNSGTNKNLLLDGGTGFVRVGSSTTPTEALDVTGNTNVTGIYKVGGVSGFTGTGSYTNFTIVGGIITAAS